MDYLKNRTYIHKQGDDKEYPKNCFIVDHRLIKFDSLRRWAKIYNRPVDTKISEYIWRLFSSGIYEAGFAKRMYIELGYEPFSGFPLLHRVTK